MKFVPASHNNFSIIGRYATTIEHYWRYSFPGVTISFKSNTRTVIFDVKDYGNNERNYFNIEVNNRIEKIASRECDETIKVDIDPVSLAWHTFSIIKRTEETVGTCEFRGVWIDDDASIEKTDQSNLKIEFIGDSITCGYGVESPNEHEGFIARKENVTLSYAGIVSKILRADASFVCYSGKGVYRGWGETPPFGTTMVDIFDRALANDASSAWDFSRFIPTIVVICLGTNDSSPPLFINRSLFIPAYLHLVGKIRSQYGFGTKIVCVTGPVLGRSLAKKHDSLVSEIVCSLNDKGDSNIYFFPFTPQRGSTGYGAQWHPSATQAHINGEELASFIVRLLDNHA